MTTIGNKFPNEYGLAFKNKRFSLADMYGYPG